KQKKLMKLVNYLISFKRFLQKSAYLKGLFTKVNCIKPIHSICVELPILIQLRTPTEIHAPLKIEPLFKI
ncbi:MAG: hypothetical protein PHT83_06685, partial [Bacilli bacterium]|nr:hypothetical protein [Bacilli bacterium]